MFEAESKDVCATLQTQAAAPELDVAVEKQAGHELAEVPAAE